MRGPVIDKQRHIAMTHDGEVGVRFYALPEQLRGYFCPLSCLTICVPEGQRITDIAPPEWATIRYTQRGGAALAGFEKASQVPVPDFAAGGPTSAALAYAMPSLRGWGLGIKPLGWALFCDGPADALADRIVNGASAPAFARFRGLREVFASDLEDSDRLAEEIIAFLLALKPRDVSAREQIIACHEALCNPNVSTVEDLAASAGLGRRTLERLTKRYFGFPPKLLLRRQRFMRSLASFKLAHHPHWSAALDCQYYDQAHFVRDFRRFMALTPTEFAAMPHPVLDQVAHQRMADHGAIQVSAGEEG